MLIMNANNVNANNNNNNNKHKMDGTRGLASKIDVTCTLVGHIPLTGTRIQMNISIRTCTQTHKAQCTSLVKQSP